MDAKEEQPPSADVNGLTAMDAIGSETVDLVANGCNNTHSLLKIQIPKHGCFGDYEELPGLFRCRCLIGTQGNYTLLGGCVKIPVDTNTVLVRLSKWVCAKSLV